MGLNSGRFVLQTRVASRLALFFFTLPCIIPPPPPTPPPPSPHCQLTSIPLVFIFPSLDSPCSHRPRIQFGLKGRPLCVPRPRWLLRSHVAEKKEAFLVLLPDSVEIFGLVSHTCKALGGHTCATGVFICGVCFTRRTARFGQSLP